MAHKRGMTLAEHNAILAADPTYQKMISEKDRALSEKQQLLENDAAALAQDLKALGWDVKTAWDLVNTATPYPRAIPVLLEHLSKPYLDRNREGIARALAVSCAAYAWPILKREYASAPIDSGTKRGLAVALSVTVNDEVMSELVALAADQANGDSRILLLEGLRRWRSPIASAALKDLCEDPALAKEIASWSTSGSNGSHSE